MTLVQAKRSQWWEGLQGAPLPVMPCCSEVLMTRVSREQTARVKKSLESQLLQ